MIFLDLYKLRCHNRMEGYGKLSLACLLFSKFILACDCLSQLVGSIYISNTFYYIYIYFLVKYVILYWKKIYLTLVQFSSVQSLSHVWLFETPWTAACHASVSITNSQSLLKLMSITSVMPANHLTLCHPLLILPSIFPSIRVFSNEAVLHITWSNYWSFSFSISLSNEYWGLISFRIYWFDLLAVQWTLKNLLQHHNSKA